MPDRMQAIEAEQAVLGAMLIDPERSVRPVVTRLIERDFAFELNRKIYRVFLDMDRDGKTIDPLTVAQETVTRKVSDEKDVRAYLAQLMETTPTAANVVQYAEIVQETGKRRHLREMLQAAADALDAGDPEDTVIQTLESGVSESQSRSSNELLTPEQQMDSFFAHRERIDSGVRPYTRTGFKTLDQMLGGGLLNQGLYFLAARPGMGKTAASLAIAEYAGKVEGTVLYFSLEMSEEQLMARRLSAITKIDSRLLLMDTLTEKEYAKVAEAMPEIGRSRVYVTAGRAMSAARISAVARSFKDVRLVVIDHFSLLLRPEKAAKHEEKADDANTLKRLAQTLDAPVLCLAQLNRANEGRASKKPMLSDLRDTGAAEEDADGVIFLYRPDYYDTNAATKNGSDPQLMEVTLAKNRHGTTGRVDMSFYAKTNTFRETYVK